MPKLETRNSKYEEPSSTTAIHIRDFKDLQVWQLARDLRREAYNLVRGFPSEEKHALANQVRRAAISVTANIAEGFGRYHYQENIQFCRQARGSVFELRDHLITVQDQGYMTAEEYRRMEDLAQRVIQTLNGYIRATQTRQKETSHGTS
jgi:four helix bundle protein